MTVHKIKWPAIRVIAIAIALYQGDSYAQVLQRHLPDNRQLIQAEEQYNQAHYNVAAQSAKAYLRSCDKLVHGKPNESIDKAAYYYAISQVKGNTKGSIPSAERTATQIANPAYAQRIYFVIAQSHFQKGEFAAAIPYYERAGIDNLNNSEITDAKFELAYCYFSNNQFDKAEPQLMAIKELKDGKYYQAGNYYYGLIAYNRNKYPEALRSFERIADAKEYSKVVPYYIAEIYYFQGKREKALKQADTVLKRKEKSFYDNELHLLAAQCLFEVQKYKEALPYFEYYYDHTDKIRKEDVYEIAYSYYKISDWDNAIEKFKMLSDTRDSLGQTSMYLLGDCYLKTGDKKSARNAFGICADMTFNTGQQEAALILYAKTSYETGFTDDALRSLNKLLATFPKSEYKDEANTLISDLLITTNNFADALKHLEQVTNKDKQYKEVYQKAAFGYAVQQFRAGDMNQADLYFSLSLQHPVAAAYTAAAYFWRGEIAYHMGHHKETISYTREFVEQKGVMQAVERISPLANMQHAWLNMGYAAMELQLYSDAQTYFGKAALVQGQDSYSGTVAALREADAVFMMKNYQRALGLYEKIAITDTNNTDYAQYQKSIILGLLGKNPEKVAILKKLITAVPPSAYANHARYETAITLLENDKYNEALPYLQQLTDSITDRSFAPKSWMKTGFIHQQQNELYKAIEAYKHVVIDYPASEDRSAALEALKNLYIQSNQPAAYTQMLRDNNLPSADSGSIDSTYYAAAETQYANGDWLDAKNAFTSYLEQYPHGIFTQNAHYYRAECYYNLKKYKEAREDYNSLLDGEWNEFYENSAVRAGAIAFNAKEYSAAYRNYERLLPITNDAQTKEIAFTGLMKSGFHAGKLMESENYADTLLLMPGISAENKNEAQYFKARIAQENGDADTAIARYKELSGMKNGDVAAESRYRIAEILLKENKLKESESAANEAIKLSAGYDNWNQKSYILLSEILVKQKDYFNAKALLQSIVKNTKNADLKQEAAKKLEEVKKLEKKQSKLYDDKHGDK